MTDNAETALVQTRGFRWGAVASRARGIAEDVSPPPPDLGPLVGFSGAFRGNGFNTIFRPQDFAVSPTPLPLPGTGTDDNILELNLTEELLSFAPSLGSIPNRGEVQGDIFLNGVPYLQTINDISDPANPVGIHFEPGVWLSVPQTTTPAEGPTLVRMASIPHGTTIDAQGISFTNAGPPNIGPVDITPFPIGTDQATNGIRFPSQDVTQDDTFRLPQDLTSFVNDGSITQDILDNPNQILSDRIASQDITST